MRLNTRLIGILFGITCIAHFGHLVLDNMPRSSRVSRSSSDSDKGFAIIFMIALVCLVLGWLGTLFGSMIKAAISRQREFLADASAVQFTRNDQGIAGALKKIGGYSYGSTLNARSTSEFSHMMFGQAQLSGLSGFFATHPPLEERIRRIEPQWDGSFKRASSQQAPASDSQMSSGFSSQQHSQYVEEVPSSDQLSEIGQQLIGQLPQPLIDIAREPYSARFIAFALIHDGSERQREMIKCHVPPASQPQLLP